MESWVMKQQVIYFFFLNLQYMQERFCFDLYLSAALTWGVFMLITKTFNLLSLDTTGNDE